MTYARLSGFLLLALAHAGIAQTVLQPPNPRTVAEHWAAYYATEYGVSVDLVEAIIDEESAWNPYAISSKGAAGLMQLMPETATRFGVRNRFQPDENIRGGVAHLASLSRKFGGDRRLITAAYYAGETPILLHRLYYSSSDVQGYVSRVARRYRARRNQGTGTGRQETRSRGEK